MARYVPNRAALSPLFFLKRKKCADFDFKRVVFYPYARNALYNAFKLMNIKSRDNVLFPSFICRTAVDPALFFTKNIKFFKVRKDLKIDIDDLKRKINRNTKAVLVAHYFGFAQDIEKIKKICDEKGVYLIEDCALSLFSRHKGKLLGGFGDFGVFSLRKTLPLFEGGALVVNNEKFPLPINRKTAFQWKYLSYRFNRYIELFRKKINFMLGRPTTQYEKRTVKKSSERGLFGDPSVFFRISSIAKFVLYHSDSRKIVEKRRKNFSFLLNKLKGNRKIKSLIRKLPEGTCPLFFPVLHMDKTAIREKLWNQNVETLVHWNRIIPGEVDRKKFKDTDYLAKREFSLPVHQDLGKEEMKFMIKKLKEII
ncbi:aminotransferase class V-fold PLP-dependent enzyme [Candidatus Woesearchaeota archaeon]|nr:aminotransferase class V-fold PLP-dependent enzyme [Candidatus Woesearchaeota archaeon]